MSSPHRPLNPRSGLVLDTHELGRRAGAMKVVQTSVEAPADLGIGVIGVPLGSPVELDLRLESVVEGVLVSGSATVEVRGECVRCLGDVSDELEVAIQELYVYPGVEPDDDLASRLEGDLIDLEPLLRDDVVLDLPFQPLCRDDCLGLCVECGATMRVSIRGGTRYAVLRVEAANLTMFYKLPHRQRNFRAKVPGGTRSEVVAVPKRRVSRSNTRHRRSQWKASVPALVTCANPACREKHLPHVACPSCGQYGPRGARRQVLSS
jgi:uncharacterized protein